MSTSAAIMRVGFGALLALFLALRVLVSAGYMPELEHGHLTLMLCPDGEWTAPEAAMPGMDGTHGSKTNHHEECFYAAAAAMPFASADAALLLTLVVFAFTVLAACALPSFARSSRLERPHSTGPPLPV
jgi:hypothetical protein